MLARAASGESSLPHRFLPSPRARSAWRGPRRAKLALEVGGGGCFSVLISMGTRGGTPHPRPLPTAARVGGERNAREPRRDSCVEQTAPSYATALPASGRGRKREELMK